MKVMVVAKRPKLDILRDSGNAEELDLLRKEPEAWDALNSARTRQLESRDSVESTLREHGVQATFLTRDEFVGPETETRLVIALGGDGTVLDVSHRVTDALLLGINSDPVLSTGYFCAGGATELSGVLAAFGKGEATVSLLHRMAIRLNGLPYEYPCLNDLLVTNENPAMTSRYVLEAGSRSELHSSSGVWISTSAGSTGGIRSAGGTVMPLEGSLVQYLVREPYFAKAGRYELQRGIRYISEGLRVRSRMSEGKVYVDGPYLTLPFVTGDLLEIGEGPSLRVVGMHPSLRER